MQAQTSERVKAGSISSKILDRLQELGFSPIQNLLELIDNSIDANAKNIWIIVEKVNNNQHDATQMDAIQPIDKPIYQLYIVDDGSGMSFKQHQKYYDLAEDKDNSENKFTIGSKGMGGKIATINLSNKGKAGIITRDANKSWSESEFDWVNEFTNGVIVCSKPSVAETDRVKHIFQEILKIPEPDSFTIINISMDPTMHEKIFNPDVELDVESNYRAIFGTIYYQKLRSGLSIRVIQTGLPDEYQNVSIEPIPLPLSDDIGISFPGHIDAEPKGTPDYTLYYRQCIYNYDRNFRMFFNQITNDTLMFELDQDSNPTHQYIGSSKNKKVSCLKFKERHLLSDAEKSDIQIKYSDYYVVNFKLQHRHLSDIPGFKRKLSEKHNINISEDSRFVQDKFYGTHLIRNGKVIPSPVIKFNEITAGDFHKRNWSKSQFTIDANICNTIIDRQFGIMVNKSTIDDKNINPCIIKLINYLTEEIKSAFTADHTAKYAAFESSKLRTEPNPITPLRTEPNPVTPLSAEPNPVTPLSAEPNPVTPLSAEPNPVTPLSAEPNPVTPLSAEPNPVTPLRVEPNPGLKYRKSLSQEDKEHIVKRQGGCEKHTGIKFSDIYRFDIDHEDEDPSNNVHTNLQALSPNLHAIKTYDRATYENTIIAPHVYNIKMGTAFLDSPVTHSKLTKELSKKVIKLVKELNAVISNSAGPAE
jgi:hypothetical protein